MHIGSYGWYYMFPALVILFTFLGMPRKWKGTIVLLLLFFFTAFRGDHVGNDTLNYINSFNYIGGNLEFGEFTSINSIGRNLEFTNIFIHRILYNLNFSERSIITVYAIITYVFIYIAYKLFRFNLLYFCLFYILSNQFYMTFNLSRQLCAVSILLVSYYYFVKGGKKNSIYSLLIMLFAATIHMSALFSIFIFVFKVIKVERNFAVIFTGIVSSFFIVTVYNPLSLIMDVLNIDYITRYMGEYDTYNRSLIGQMYSLIILLSKLFLFYSFSLKVGKSPQSSLIDLLFLASIIIESMFDGADGMMRRISLNFSIIQCVYLSYIMNDLNIKTINIKVVALLFLILLQLYGVGSYGYNGAFISGYYLIF